VKILIVHQYYLGPDEPGGSRFNEFARLWKCSGHHVSVIAGSLNYATGKRSNHIAPGWLTKLEEDGIAVWRCYVPASYSRSYLGRMWAFLAFTLSASCAAFFVQRPDVVIATSPPLTAAIPGFIAARIRLRPAPWVFEIRDLWPESAITTGIIRAGSAVARLLYTLERFACKRADAVTVLTPAFAEDLQTRGLVTPDRILFVPNGADVDAFTPASRNNDVRLRFGWGSRFVALYAGAHGRANALHQLLDAATHLSGRSDILIVTVGDGPARASLEEEARTRQLGNVQIIGPVVKEWMPHVVAAADAGIAVLQDNPTFRTVYPNKVFDYMASARPTVLGIDGVARRLVCDEARAGIFAEPENAGSIAAAIVRLADAPEDARRLGRNGREWIVANAARSALAQRYLDALVALSSSSATRTAPASRRSSPPTIYLRYGKRLLDICVAAAALIILSPVTLVTVLLVRFTLGSPVLFRQTRPGKDGRPFTILKFRTMRVVPGDEDDAVRLTAVGRLLRSLSLDELPELVNVLRGQMSLVGPRPLLMRYLDRYTPEQARRHEVTPGMTGWAQVHGRNALGWDEKFRLDVWYVEHCSLSIDLRILARTVWALVTRDGITQPGHVTVAEFFGPSNR
jgi:lipopolysaccharide/colanic/teichoic acid biosynthesis glycosyltransferase/glycosyltransferase involved in cell wall biosynthesis